MREAPADNIFGKILRGELPSYCVYQDNAVYAFLDIYPQSPGHTLVIPRSYSENVLVADEADIAATLAATRRIALVVQRAVSAPGVTILTNTGRDAGQMIEYLHWHIIPRHSGDKVSLSQLGPQASADDLAAIAGRIQQELQTN